MARLAYSLETLRSQVDGAYPNRSKVSDGWLGDAAHQAVASDHNPNPADVVTALDLTHDTANGFDAHTLADRLLAKRHPNLKYVISNGRIAGAWTGWKWAPYSGTSNPHVKHIHVSVGVGDDGKSAQPYDDRTLWNVTEGGDDMANTIQSKPDADLVALAVLNEYLQGDDWKNLLGLTWPQAIKALYESPQWLDQNHKLKIVLPKLEQQVKELSIGGYEQVTEPLYRKVNK